MFEYAARTKMRFPYRGYISAEDLWDLNVKELDSVFKVLNSQLKQAKEESLLQIKTKEDQELDVKIKIIKHIVKVKIEEDSARIKSKEKREQKQKILEIISAKQDESLQNKSMEELMAMLNELE